MCYNSVMRCIAITKNGSQCKNNTRGTGEFCAIHTNTPVDVAPFAESLPGNLVDDFADSLGWKKILSNRADLAYLEARKAELLRQTGGGRNYFNEVNDAWRIVEFCTKSGDTAGREAALRDLGDVIERGKRSERYKTEILDIIERARRLRESEIKAETSIGLLVPTAQVLLEMKQYVALVMFAVKRLTDGDTYLRLARELEALQNNPPLLEQITSKITIDL